jgi:hypothetical protein
VDNLKFINYFLECQKQKNFNSFLKKIRGAKKIKVACPQGAKIREQKIAPQGRNRPPTVAKALADKQGGNGKRKSRLASPRAECEQNKCPDKSGQPNYSKQNSQFLRIFDKISPSGIVKPHLTSLYPRKTTSDMLR